MDSSSSNVLPDRATDETDRTQLMAARGAIGEVVFGQNEIVDHALTCLLAGGNALLMGVPGLAKTRLAHVMGQALGLDTRRLQCTPELTPTDIVGCEVTEEGDYGKRVARFIEGPVFCQLLLVDEINRANPRAQSALLQAMEERRVTIHGREHALPTPFHLFGTQNPLEHDGVFPLPEAQRDRFLMQIDVPYPDLATERRLVAEGHDDLPRALAACLTASALSGFQRHVRTLPLDPPIQDLILAIVRSGRPGTTTLPLVQKYVAWGPGPRASQAFGRAVRARAFLGGRLAPETADVLALVRPLLNHRLRLLPLAQRDGVSVDDILHAMVAPRLVHGTGG